MTGKQHYMTWEERQKLEVMYNNLRLSVSVIAKTLGFCRQTIYNELKVGLYWHTVDYRDVKRYSAMKAQQLHAWYQSAKGRPEKIGHDQAFADFLEKKIHVERFSPAAALAAARKAGYELTICTATLYNYIYKGLFRELTPADLWNRPKRKHRKPETAKRIPHPKLPMIDDRPAEASERSGLGHWEMDLIVGKAGTRPVLLTLTERSTRRELIFLLSDRKAATIRGVFDRLERRHGKHRFRQLFQTITTDNGSEFLQYDELRRSVYGGTRFAVYYCHSYAAWEKGTNENQNRMIRRWFPKGTDFGKISRRQVQAVERWMNNYPRRILGWMTPIEAAQAMSA